MEMKIKIGSKEHSFNSYEVANEFIDNIVDSDSYNFLLKDLAESNSYSILSNLANSDKLTLEVYKKLIRSRSEDVINNLIRSSKFKEFVCKEDLEYIIDTFPYEVIETLARYIEHVPEELFDFCYKKLISVNIKEITCQLARNSFLPINYLKELAENEDLTIAKYAKEELVRMIERI